MVTAIPAPLLRCGIRRFILTQNQVKIYALADAAVQQKGVITMPAKANPEPAANWYQVSPFSALTGWAKQAAEGFFATQRILLDLVMRQNATTMSAIRDRLSEVRSISMDAMTEMAGEGISNMIAAERVLLHLA